MPLGRLMSGDIVNRVVWRTTSWLLSTQVVGAPTAALAASDDAIAFCRSVTRQGVVR